MTFKTIASAAAVAFIFSATTSLAAPVELTSNGDLETGDFTGWTLFPSAPGNITVFAPGNASAFCGYIDNQVEASPSLVKQANLGIGTVLPGEIVTISFDARGSFGVGGVAFAEFFSEISGGGVSSSVLLGGAPLALDADPNVWKTFSFTTTTGPDVSGGVTLQIAAITGAIIGSTAQVYFDNASVTVDRGPVSVEDSSWGQVKQLYR